RGLGAATGVAPLARFRAGRPSLRRVVRRAFRGVLPRSRHGRGPARRDRVTSRGRALSGLSPRVGARGEEARVRRGADRGGRGAHRRNTLRPVAGTARDRDISVAATGRRACWEVTKPYLL